MNETKSNNPHGVKVGDIWKDCDKRVIPRHLRVVEIAETHATVREISRVTGAVVGRKVKIRLDRFKPTSTGYRRIKEGAVPTECIHPNGGEHESGKRWRCFDCGEVYLGEAPEAYGI